MKRRDFMTLVGGAGVALPLAALAQEAGRTYRLGCLSPFTRDNVFNVLFFDKLRRRGFIEGQNLTIDYRAFTLHLDLISQYAAELVTAQPDVIYGGGGVAIRAVQQATKSICAQSGSPRMSALIELSSRSGANFHPLREDRGTTWNGGRKKPSKLVTELPRDSRRSSPRSDGFDGRPCSSTMW